MQEQREKVKALPRSDGIHQLIQGEIKMYIIRNGLLPGDPLPSEGSLAADLEVSRGSVREAVKSLEVLGVIDVQRGRGLFVKEFSFDPLLKNLSYGMLIGRRDVTDLLELRLHLETSTAKRVVATIDDETVAQLRDVYARMEAAAERGEYSADDDQAFHRLLYSKLSNDMIRRLIDVFWSAFREMGDAIEVPGPLDPVETSRRHEEILIAVEARDQVELELALERHYRGIQARLGITDPESAP